ncbi:MAG: hypothetical protein NTZ78_14980 [Candidatus Aureabacteria bacterium]|nr:hypothetical protein [Candidatus Auribacterota bacterium]
MKPGFLLEFTLVKTGAGILLWRAYSGFGPVIRESTHAGKERIS